MRWNLRNNPQGHDLGFFAVKSLLIKMLTVCQTL